MSLTSILNLNSLSSQVSLGRTQDSMGKSLEKLSSGLKINSAADNPSGLAISEKMRGYIKGLQRASSNAQDGISYLQTAEGSTNEVTSMLQRMRELAVQGANGTYTTNDRNEIQKEMDQLKEEVDRIASTSEYNTKKLLNGESSGVWNTSTDKIGAVITGPVADGNYDIDIDVIPGKNQIMQSDILTIRDGAIGAELTGANSTNITRVKDPNNLPPTDGSNYTVTVGDSIITDDNANFINAYQQEGTVFIPGPITNVSASASGYMQIEFLDDTDTGGAAGTRFRAKFISAEDGKEGPWMEFTSGVDGSLSASYTAGGFNVSFEMNIASGVDSIVHKGDKLLMAVTDTKGIVTPDSLLISGGGTVQVSQNGVNGPTVVYPGANSLTKPDNKDGVEDINDIVLHMVTLDPKTGSFDKGSMTIGFAENTAAGSVSGSTLGGTTEVEIRGGGEAATSTTKLSDIANFTDADGNDILQAPQELRVYGNSKNASIILEGADTLIDFQNKMTQALVKGLDMGSNDTAINKKLVDYLPNSEGEGLRAVRGTILLQTALTGSDSELNFIGNQRLLSALGFSQVQKAENNLTKVSVRENLTGVSSGEILTSGNRAQDIIKGVDITIDTRTGVEAQWDSSTGSMIFAKSHALDNFNMNLHIVDQRTKVQIGVAEGQSIDISIPQLDTKALGIDKSVITSQEEAQKSIANIDEAMTKVTSVRGTLGAQISRLESSYNNLLAAKENMVSSESRIRDLDIAAETAAYTSAQVMSQAGIAMLAQANQLPQLALSLLK